MQLARLAVNMTSSRSAETRTHTNKHTQIIRQTNRQSTTQTASWNSCPFHWILCMRAPMMAV